MKKKEKYPKNLIHLIKVTKIINKKIKELAKHNLCIHKNLYKII